MSSSSAPSDVPSQTQSFTSAFSTPTALSTESPTPTPSQTSLTSSAALYLYTFLATLVLLLAVSSAIVIRSLVLRRRHQRLVEEAIRAGTWVPHQFGRRRRDIGEKPRLWDAWIQNVHDDHGGGGDGSEKGNWDDIMPVCAVRIDHSTSSSSTTHPTSAPPSTTEPLVEPQARPSWFLRPFYRRPSQHDTILPMTERQPPSSDSSPSPSSSSQTAAAAVRVAVLIAMPSPPQHTHNKPDEDGPPVVELGVVEVGLREEGGDSVGP